MSTVDVAETGSAPGIGSGSSDTPPPPEQTAETALARTLQRLARGDLLVVVMSFVFAFLIGSVLIVIADQEVRETLGYFFARPSDALTAIWQSVSEAYRAMFRGAIFDGIGWQRAADAVREAGGSGTYVLIPALSAGLRPLTETLTVATPLIIASAGMAVSFRAGLFNIGGTGQLIVGAMAAGYVGFAVQLPVVLHLLVALLAGVLAGGVWGGIAAISGVASLAGYLLLDGAAPEVLASVNALAAGANSSYVDDLAADGGLGDSKTFTSVVPDADGASMVAFVDFDANGDWLAELAGDDAEVKRNIEPLKAAGLSAWADEDAQHVKLRLTTD